MERFEVVQHLLSLYETPSYLEVGVNRGGRRRLGLLKRREKWLLILCFYLKCLSRMSGRFTMKLLAMHILEALSSKLKESFNVIYLDGLHTFEQTLRDFTNAIERIPDDGCILIDDIRPNSYHASLPSQELAVKLRTQLGLGDKDKSWMGDTFRLLFFIQTFFQQYSYATVADNHGQLVVWKKLRSDSDIVERKVEELGRYPFENIILDVGSLNLMPMSEIVVLIKRDQS